MRIAIIGYTQSGKTEVGNILAEMLMTDSLSTSDILMADYCLDNGVSMQDLVAHKDQYRESLYNYGLDKQQRDPHHFVKAALQTGDIIVGIRNQFELRTSSGDRLFDLVIWVERNGVVAGSTDKISIDDADLVLYNNGTIEDLKDKLRLFALWPMTGDFEPIMRDQKLWKAGDFGDIEEVYTHDIYASIDSVDPNP